MQLPNFLSHVKCEIQPDSEDETFPTIISVNVDNHFSPRLETTPKRARWAGILLACTTCTRDVIEPAISNGQSK